MRFLFFVMAALSAVIFSGCASICSKSQYPVTVATNAPDADIFIRNSDSGMIIQSGKSPLAVTLPASKSFFTPASYQCEVKCNEKKQYRTISADIDPWFFGNFILGGLIGMAIDGASGAAYKLEDAYYIHFSEFDN